MHSDKAQSFLIFRILQVQLFRPDPFAGNTLLVAIPELVSLNQ